MSKINEIIRNKTKQTHTCNANQFKKDISIKIICFVYKEIRISKIKQS